MLAGRVSRTLLMTITIGVLLATLANNINVIRATASSGEPDWKSFTVKARDQSYHVQYWITGGRVVDMVPDIETNSLTITITSAADGKLSIMLPRELVDTTVEGTSGQDTAFAVFVDGIDVIPDELKVTNMTRTLAIDFDEGARRIEIIGTFAGMSVPSTDGWNTINAVGKFLNSDPSRPDQIFKVQYRVLNGSLERFDITQIVQDEIVDNGLVATVNSSGAGTLEINFPRNFPYTNSQSGIENFVFFVENRTIEVNGVTTDCFFAFSVPFVHSSEIEMGMPSILMKAPYHGDNIPNSCIAQTVAGNEGYGAIPNPPTVEQLAECSQLGIAEENCTDIAILQRHQQLTLERKTIEETKIQVNNAMYMIGIGAAIAGVFAIITLGKRK